MVVKNIFNTPQRVWKSKSPNRARMCTVVKAARTKDGKVVSIVPGGMVDVALHELGARLTEAERF